jgi:hypothetical protein
MLRSSFIRLAVAAFAALAFAATTSSSQAASGSVRLVINKASFIVGVAGGEGMLRFGRRTYPLSVGGLSVGLSGGVSQANLVGTVSNIRRASDVAGTYSATTAGAALITGGKQVVMLRNEKGATLQLRGAQVGVEINLDVSGLVIGFR